MNEIDTGLHLIRSDFMIYYIIGSTLLGLFSSIAHVYIIKVKKIVLVKFIHKSSYYVLICGFFFIPLLFYFGEFKIMYRQYYFNYVFCILFACMNLRIYIGNFVADAEEIKDEDVLDAHLTHNKKKNLF